MKLIVLLLPCLLSNATDTALFTSADISAAHLSPIEVFVPDEDKSEYEIQIFIIQKMENHA